MSRGIRRNSVIAHHLILSGYGHWLPNDIRGSGSAEVRREPLAELGPIHQGRKRQQPPRGEVRAFHDAAEARLLLPVLWFDAPQRELIGRTLGGAVRAAGYTVWACAVLPDHVHLCVRVHRDRSETMWSRLTDATRAALHDKHPEWVGHRIWAERPYAVYLSSPEDVRRTMRYVEGNPIKHRLPAQTWGFVVPYDGWPHR